MIKTDLQPIRTHKKEAVDPENGKPLEIILNVYDRPINKNPTIQIYSQFVIMDGPSVWGYGMFQQPVPEDIVLQELNSIEKTLHLYKV